MKELPRNEYQAPRKLVRDIVQSPPWGSPMAVSIGEKIPEKVLNHLVQLDLTPETELQIIAQTKTTLSRRATEHTIVAEGLKRLLQPNSAVQQFGDEPEIKDRS